jgi:hypothetical protein
MDDSYDFSGIRWRAESRKAHLCEVAGRLFWIPKSQIIGSDFRAGIVTTTLWWAEVSGARDAYEELGSRLGGIPETSNPLPTASLIYRYWRSFPK